MKILASYFLLLSQLCLADGNSARTDLDARSKAEFLKLNFFSEGRGMHLVPEAIEAYEKIKAFHPARKWLENKMKNDWGFNVVNHQVVGLFNEPYKNMNIGVLGCVACHSGKAAGIFIPGLGNKNIDVVAVGKAARFFQKLYLKLKLKEKKGADYQEARQSALTFADRLSNEKIGNLTQGHVTVSFIRQWFYDQAGESAPESIGRGGVKVPALWGYGEKRKVGQFSDGFGNGQLPGWAIAVELTAGQSVEAVRNYLPKVVAAEDLFAHFLPPPYPFEIDFAQAGRGEQVFVRNCRGCHGSYSRDAESLPIYEAPRWIPLQAVGTDPDRLKSNTPHFRDLVRQNPLRDVLQITDFGDGYFAPRLVGIWARFPYLHNASVPNIEALLAEPEARPEVFSLKDAGEAKSFDPESLGLKLPKNPDDTNKLMKKAKKKDRKVFWTAREGHSSMGHNFGTQLAPSDKRDLVEYLKTL